MHGATATTTEQASDEQYCGYAYVFETASYRKESNGMNKKSTVISGIFISVFSIETILEDRS